MVGISNGQVIFNVSDELTEDMYEVVDAEDPVVEAGRVKYAIQTFASVSLWIPKKILHRYWKRRHVIILPHWAFNKLILGNLVQIWDTVYIHFYYGIQLSKYQPNNTLLFCSFKSQLERHTTKWSNRLFIANKRYIVKEMCDGIALNFKI